MSERTVTNPALLALLLAIVVAAFPAWTGSWVYDDWPMQSSEKMDDVGDLLAVFERTSQDYVNGGLAGGVTYRPLSAASLIAVEVTTDGPLLHHLVSLLLHLVCVVLLFLVASPLSGPRVALAIAMVFGLHPLGIEAYGWINGRSDGLAALGVMLTAFGLFNGRTLASRLGFGVVGCVIGALAKEPALASLTGVVCGAFLSSREAFRHGTRYRAEVLVPGLACGGVMFASLLLRAAVAGVSHSAASVFEAPDTATAMVRLFGVALRSLVLPSPRTMRNLGYELAQPLGVLELALLLGALTTVGLLAYQRQFRALTLVAFGWVSLVPCVVVRHAFWSGLDRYLYLPLLLTCLALGTASEARDWQVVQAKVARIATLAVGAALLLTTWITADTYGDQTKHMLAMMEMRPNDSTGYLVGAEWLWKAEQQEGGRALLDKIPREGLPPSHAFQLATLLGKMGRRDDALAVVNAVARSHPDDLYVLSNLVGVRLEERRVEDSLAAAERLRNHPAFCKSVRTLLDQVQNETWPPDQVATTKRFLATYPCE